MRTEKLIKNNKGLTIIELLTALAIMAAAGTGLLRITAVFSEVQRADMAALQMNEENRKIQNCIDRELMNASAIWIRKSSDYEKDRNVHFLCIVKIPESSERNFYYGFLYNEETHDLYYAELTAKYDYDAADLQEEMIFWKEPAFDQEECLLGRCVSDITFAPLEEASNVIRYEYELSDLHGITRKYRSEVALRNSADIVWLP